MSIKLMKTEYDSLIPSDGLKDRIEAIVKRDRKKRILKYASASVAALLIAVTCALNVSPAIALAAQDIPVVGQIVKVLTFSRFEYKDSGYEAEIVAPEIHGLLDPELQDRLNAEFRAEAETLTRAFESDVMELKQEFGEELVNMSFKSNYVVKANNDRVLSLDTYIYSDVSSFVIHKYYTIDKRRGKLIKLEELFKSGVDYITPISGYIAGEMIRINEEENGLFCVGDSPILGERFAEIKADQNFYINESGKLVICFDKYEVAAGTQGSPEFVIPKEVIGGILDSDII